MIVEKIIQDYQQNSSILFCKDTSEIFRTKLPQYKEDTELELGIDGIFHIKTEDEYWNEIDAFFSEVYHTLSLKKIDDLIYQGNRMGFRIYQMYRRFPYSLYEIKRSDESDILSIQDICRIANPTTFKGKQEEIKYLTTYILTKLRQDSGSTWTEFQKVYHQVNLILQKNGKGISIEEYVAHINYWVDLFYINREEFTLDSPMALLSDYRNEMEIYNTIKQSFHNNSPFCDYRHEIDEDLSEEQNNAISRLVLEKGNISILTGGPGTGKTTVLKKLVMNMQRCYPSEQIALLSPTGKAAKRISEVMGDMDITISTIHKFLGYQVDRSILLTKEKQEELLNTHLVIIDESSMLGSSLFYDLMKYLDMTKTKVILVGDIDQLPSIDAGALLRDLQSIGVFTAYLNNNFRSDGKIVENSKIIRKGNTTLEFEEESFILTNDSIYDYVEDIMENQESIILSPYRTERIEISADNMNKEIHNIRSTYGDTSLKFRPREKVIVTRTQYQNKKAVYINGDVGTILTAYRQEDGCFIYEVELGEDRVKVPESDLDYGYALTIHKSQGSEYNTVHIVIPEFSNFVTKKMLYTAITRAKQRVYLHTTKEILDKIIKNENDDDRNTFLGLQPSLVV